MNQDPQTRHFLPLEEHFLSWNQFLHLLPAILKIQLISEKVQGRAWNVLHIGL